MSVLVEIICLIIFVNPINWKDLGLFTFTQATIFQFWTPDSLRVFGCGTPNGSLWTICVMIQFYIVVWFAKKICRRKSIAFWIITELLLMLIGAATKYVELLVPEIVYKLYCNTIVQYLWIFWLGIIIAEYKDTVVSFFARYWYIPLVCAFLFRFSSFDLWSRGYPIIFCTLCLIALIGLAYKLPTMNIRTDISYALFIYHMIVVNVIIELGYADSGIPFVMCILVSFVLAILSTTFVGKNVAKFKVK